MFGYAIGLAEKAALTVLVMGLDQTIEREGQDRLNITLPGFQDELIAQVVSATEGVVILVVLSGGCWEWSVCHNLGRLRWNVWRIGSG